MAAYFLKSRRGGGQQDQSDDIQASLEQPMTQDDQERLSIIE